MITFGLFCVYKKWWEREKERERRKIERKKIRNIYREKWWLVVSMPPPRFLSPSSWCSLNSTRTHTHTLPYILPEREREREKVERLIMHTFSSMMWCHAIPLSQRSQPKWEIDEETTAYLFLCIYRLHILPYMLVCIYVWMYVYNDIRSESWEEKESERVDGFLGLLLTFSL